jgi:hypothetical protein
MKVIKNFIVMTALIFALIICGVTLIMYGVSFIDASSLVALFKSLFILMANSIAIFWLLEKFEGMTK